VAGCFTFPTGISKLEKLTINRSAGATTTHNIDLDDAVPADSVVLVLTDGILYMNNSSIIQLNSDAIKRYIDCSDASHVDGIMQGNIEANSGMHIFPVGDAGICRPMALEAQNGNNNTEQIQFIYNTPPNSLNFNTSNLPGGIFQHFYWKHKNLSTTNMQRRLYFEREDFPGYSDADLNTALYLANTKIQIPINKTETKFVIICVESFSLSQRIKYFLQ